MRRPARTARRFAGARDGSVLPLLALAGAALLGSAALAVDVGSLFFAKRRLQGAVDLAAIVAAQAPDRGETLARRSLADNGFETPTGLVVESGHYVPDPALAAASRFRVGALPANAVRVAISARSPLVFGRAITGRPDVAMDAVALAARGDSASLSIGSRLASLDGGIANAVLGSMLGSQLGLSVMDYRALADAKLDALRMLDEAALSLDLKGATYSDVLGSRIGLGPLTGAMAIAGQAPLTARSAAGALGQVAQAARGGAARVPIAKALGIGDLGAGAAGLAASRPLPVGALDIVTAVAAVANGARQVQLDLGSGLPGLASARLTLAVGEPPQGLAAAAAPGATVTTAQTRLLLETSITAPLGLGRLAVPVYVEIAPAQATLDAIGCPWLSADELSATVSARPGVVEAAIADVAAAGITAAGARPDLGRSAELARLPLLTVSGRSRVTVASPAAQTLVFTRADIDASRARTVGTQGLATSLTTSLLANLSVEVDIVGLGIGSTAASVRQGVRDAIAGALPGIDLVLDTTLSTLGVGVGQADVRVHGARCDRAVLVQ